MTATDWDKLWAYAAAGGRSPGATSIKNGARWIAQKEIKLAQAYEAAMDRVRIAENRARELEAALGRFIDPANAPVTVRTIIEMERRLLWLASYQVAHDLTHPERVFDVSAWNPILLGDDAHPIDRDLLERYREVLYAYDALKELGTTGG